MNHLKIIRTGHFEVFKAGSNDLNKMIIHGKLQTDDPNYILTIH